VNLSSLARQIQKDLGLKNFEAVKAALRRLSGEMTKTKHKREEKVLQLLRKSKVSVYDGDAVLITEEPLKVEDKFRVNLGKNWVYLLEKNQIPKSGAGILRKTEGCTTIIIDSPEEIEEVPGVVAYLTSVLAEQAVNVFEFISCWRYTIIVVDRKDSLRAYEVLSQIIG